MRLRRKKDAMELLKANPYVIIAQEKQLFNFECFSKKQPVQIEIGMGKGDYIIAMAQKYPHINFIGIERYDSVLAIAASKLEDLKIENLKLLLFDASDISTLFEKSIIDHVYLNFSDPWPKKRHAKRRLTYSSFLKQYDHILKPKGGITLKTDNIGLAEFSIASFANHGYYFKDVSLNLHQNELLNQNNIMTEYERKFSSMGYPIYRIEVYKYE